VVHSWRKQHLRNQRPQERRDAGRKIRRNRALIALSGSAVAGIGDPGRLGSARVSRAGERVLAIANFCMRFDSAFRSHISKGRLFRRDAETNTRDACAPRSTRFRSATRFKKIMENRCAGRVFSSALFVAAFLSIAVQLGAAAESNALLTGKAAMGDWKSDAPGMRRKISVADLPAPSSNVLAINSPHVI